MSLTDWLISYYKFDENAWTTAFDSVGSNDWTLVNWTSRVAGKINTWLSFDWTNDYVNLTNNITYWLWDFSWCIWVKRSETTTRVLLSKWMIAPASAGQDYVSIITYWDWVVWFRLAINGVNLHEAKTTTWYNDNNRHHIVWTRQWWLISIYIDWSHQQTVSYTTYNIDNVANLTLGNFSHLIPSTYYKWLADEIAIYTRSLTESEVTELYNWWAGLQYPFWVWGKKNNIFMYW